MDGIPLRSLTPDADASFMTPRSASYCELGFTDTASIYITTAESQPKMQ